MMNGGIMLACLNSRQRAAIVFGRRNNRSIRISADIASSASSLSSKSRQRLVDRRCWYSSTKVLNDENDEAATATKPSSSSQKLDKKQLRQIALEYGRRKANYKRQVSELRKNYMNEYQANVAEDFAVSSKKQAEMTRKRLERQRTKNIRSVENAKRQKELQRQAHLAFQDHLKQEQEKRDAKAILFNKARQLCIDELEEEAPLWLTTPEEVEAAFTPEAEQLLWGRPRGVLGAPNPTLDSHYWSYETHTWDMSKTYTTGRELLLEKIEDEVYEKTNLDKKFWTPERLKEHEELERKAKLRANVRSIGRRNLLKRQKEMLDADNETKPGDVPKPPPIPSLGVLANIQAQEKEGSESLFKDPTQFFIFDGDKKDYSDDGDNNEGSNDNDDGENESSYSGPSLGTPIELRDPLRSGGHPDGDVFPMGIGKIPKPDTRSESEKKREEREQRLWAAAQQKEKADDAAEGDEDENEMFGEPIDYDNNEDYDSDDEEWEKGLDPETDSDLLHVPREYRFREDDIDWVIDQLKAKGDDLQSHFRSTVISIEQNKRAQLMAAAASKEEDSTATEGGDDDEEYGSFFDEESTALIQNAGGDIDKYEKLMSSLTEEQLLNIYALQGQKPMDDDGDFSSTSSVFATIDGLTQEQIADLTELERLLHEAEKEEPDNDLF